jgi:hypothetical protein
MARWFVNPRKRKKRTRGGGRVRRPRVRVRGQRFILGLRSPFKGRIHRVNPLVSKAGYSVKSGPSRFILRNPIIRNPSIIRNPFIREVGMFRNARHRRRRGRRNPIIRNPAGSLSIGNVMRNPMQTVTTGFVAVGSAYMTNTIPNMLGMFQGTDLVSKALRGLLRVVVGGFVYGAVRSFAPRHAQSAAVGAAVGSIGATVLDFMNTRLVLGYGDVTQSPMTLFAGVGTMFSGGVAGYGAYARPMGAYARPMGRLRGMRGIYGGQSMGMMRTGSSIYT